MDEVKDYSDFVKKFNNLSEDQIEAFVKERFQQLENSTPILEYDETLLLERVYQGYINSKSSIKASNLVNPFYINQLDLYYQFLINLKKDGQLIPNVDIVFKIQKFIFDKFGPYCDEKERRKIYIDYENSEEKEGISISKFYGNGAALCVERAAVVQNLLSFVGLKSYMISGKIMTDGVTQSHAYNIFEPKEGMYLLYDVTNWLEIKNISDGNKYCYPAYINIGEKPKEEIIFDYNKVNLKEDYIIVNKEKRTYQIPYDIDLEHSEYRNNKMR